MTHKKVKGASSYDGALLICQNLAKLTAYELVGDQILMPGDGASSPTTALSLVLMPGVSLASSEMAKGIAMLGTSALGVRCLLGDGSERIADFTVLFAEEGRAERFAFMRPWLSPDGDLYLIPSEDAEAGKVTSFKFDRGLRKAKQPWFDQADRKRGLDEAFALLLADETSDRLG